MFPTFLAVFFTFQLSFTAHSPQSLPCGHGVHSRPGHNSQLSWSDGRTQTLPYQVNALASKDGHLYALATHSGGTPLPDGVHLVDIAPDGTVTDHGPLSRDLAIGYAGTMVDGRFYIASASMMYVLDPTTRATVARIPLDTSETLGDWDYDPTDKALYAVTSTGRKPAALIRVDPTTGATRTIATLPGNSAYGAAFLGPDRVLYTLRNDATGRSDWYAIPLNDPASLRHLGAGPTAASSDAAGCTPTPRQVPPSQQPQAPAPGVPLTPLASPSAPPSPSPSSSPSPTVNAPPLPPLLPVAAEPAAEEQHPRRMQRWVAVTVIGLAVGGMSARRLARR